MNTSILIHLAELLAKSILLLAPALILAAAMRRCSAAWRHTVLLAALAALLLLPLGKFAVPYWRLQGPPAKPLPMPTWPVVVVAGSTASAGPAAATASSKYPRLKLSDVLLGGWLTGTSALLAFRAFGGWQIAMLKRRRTTPADEPVTALAEA